MSKVLSLNEDEPLVLAPEAKPKNRHVLKPDGSWRVIDLTYVYHTPPVQLYFKSTWFDEREEDGGRFGWYVTGFEVAVAYKRVHQLDAPLHGENIASEFLTDAIEGPRF